MNRSTAAVTLGVAGLSALIGYTIGKERKNRPKAFSKASSSSTQDISPEPEAKAADFFDCKGVDISDNFDSGNIHVVDSSDPNNVQLKIKPDPFTEITDNTAHCQWFYFRACGVKSQSTVYNIVNAGKSSYPEAWPGYNVVFSYNPAAASPIWRRLSTKYDTITGELKWTHNSERDLVWFAYFAPYSFERHQNLMAEMSESPLANIKVIGRSIEGRRMDQVVIGTGPRVVWLIGRQHPGETQASW